MKIRYCVSLLLLCAATIFSKSTTANADDRVRKTVWKDILPNLRRIMDQIWVRQDGFTYLYSDKKIYRQRLLRIPMEQKKVAVPGKDQW